MVNPRHLVKELPDHSRARRHPEYARGIPVAVLDCEWRQARMWVASTRRAGPEFDLA
jgi:hypothetical protein